LDVEILADDRQGLLRDISEVFAKEKMNVVGVNTQSIKGVAWMTFTVEVVEISRMAKVSALINEVTGVRSVRRHGS
jgi:GTP pyrophosphokinase